MAISWLKRGYIIGCSSASPTIPRSILVEVWTLKVILDKSLQNYGQIQSLKQVLLLSVHQLGVSCMSAVCQLYVSCVSAVCQLYVSCLSAVCQLYVSCLRCITVRHSQRINTGAPHDAWVPKVLTVPRHAVRHQNASNASFVHCLEVFCASLLRQVFMR